MIRLLLDLENEDQYRQIEEAEQARLQEDIDKMEYESQAAFYRDPILVNMRLDKGWSEEKRADQLIQDSSYADIIEQRLEAARQARK